MSSPPVLSGTTYPARVDTSTLAGIAAASATPTPRVDTSTLSGIAAASGMSLAQMMAPTTASQPTQQGIQPVAMPPAAVGNSTPNLALLAQYANQINPPTPVQAYAGQAPQAPQYISGGGSSFDLSGILAGLQNTPVAPLDLSSLAGIIGAAPKIEAPNIQFPKYNAPTPERTPLPNQGSVLDLLRQYGLLPGDSGNGVSGGAMGQNYNVPSISAPGVSAPSVSFSPTALNQASVQDRVNQRLDLKYRPATDQANFNLEDLKAVLAATQGALTGYGTAGDAKLKEVYDQLHNTLGSNAGTINNLYSGATDKIKGFYNDSTNSFNSNTQGAVDSIAGLAAKLGLSQGLPDASKYFLSNIQDMASQQAGDKANSLANIATLGANMGAAGQRDVSIGDATGASRRGDLASLVASAQSQGQLNYQTSRQDIMEQLYMLSQQRGLEAPIMTNDLETQDWERNYQTQKDTADFGLRNAQMQLQASTANAQMQLQAQTASQQAAIDMARLASSDRQSTVQMLMQAFGMDRDTAMEQYKAEQDYQARLENHYGNQYNAEIAGAGMGLDVWKTTAGLQQSAYGQNIDLASLFGNLGIQSGNQQIQQQQNNNSNLLNFAGLGLQQQGLQNDQRNAENSYNASMYNNALGQFNNDRNYATGLNESNRNATYAAQKDNRDFSYGVARDDRTAATQDYQFNQNTTLDYAKALAEIGINKEQLSQNDRNSLAQLALDGKKYNLSYEEFKETLRQSDIARNDANSKFNITTQAGASEFDRSLAQRAAEFKQNYGFDAYKFSQTQNQAAAELASDNFYKAATLSMQAGNYALSAQQLQLSIDENNQKLAAANTPEAKLLATLKIDAAKLNLDKVKAQIEANKASAGAAGARATASNASARLTDARTATLGTPGATPYKVQEYPRGNAGIEAYLKTNPPAADADKISAAALQVYNDTKYNSDNKQYEANFRKALNTKKEVMKKAGLSASAISSVENAARAAFYGKA